MLKSVCILAVTLASVGSCEQRVKQETAPVEPATQSVAPTGSTASAAPEGAPASVSKEDLQRLLAGMAKSHEDKIKLGNWAGTPFLPVGGAFKPFFGNMHKQNKELLAELKGWAKAHNVDLTNKPSNDVEGRAQQVMEDRQEKIIRGDKQADFEHDILIQIYTDYDWNYCLIQALLPRVQDPALKAYLQKSLKMFENGSGEIRGLLKRYKFQ